MPHNAIDEEMAIFKEDDLYYINVLPSNEPGLRLLHGIIEDLLIHYRTHYGKDAQRAKQS